MAVLINGKKVAGSGRPGADATINGVNTLNILPGENIQISQQGSNMTISATGGVTSASDAPYDPGTSGLEATNVQAALDELATPAGFVISATAPTDTNSLWIDTSIGGVLKYYNSGAWQNVLSVWGSEG